MYGIYSMLNNVAIVFLTTEKAIDYSAVNINYEEISPFQWSFTTWSHQQDNDVMQKAV